MNWTNVREVVPRVIVLFEQTKATSPYEVPCSTNTAPATSSDSESASVARVGAPLALTVYIPFSEPVVWSFMSILSPVARVTPSITLALSKAVASVPLAVVVAFTEAFHLRPAIALST